MGDTVEPPFQTNLGQPLQHKSSDPKVALDVPKDIFHLHRPEAPHLNSIVAFKILPGDRVTVELSPYDLDRGRITYRYK